MRGLLITLLSLAILKRVRSMSTGTQIVGF